jgi:hypothetical protein
MKSLFITLMVFLSFPNISFAQESINNDVEYVNDITFYIDFKDKNKKPYCINIDINSMLTVTEPAYKSCGIKQIDYEVAVEKDNKYSILPITNKVLKEQSFTDPIFALKIGLQATGLLFQMVTGNFKPEKVY